MNPEEKIRSLQGPILVLGAAGFVGANLFRQLAVVRDDVFGTSRSQDPWRLQGLEGRLFVGVFDPDQSFAAGRPEYKTVFNLLAHGGYSWQTDAREIRSTNFELTCRIVDDLADSNIAAYVHAGSSSEYGTNCTGPREDDPCFPNSAYAASKLAGTHYLRFMSGRGFPAAVLRLASVYGPWEDPGRLIPRIVTAGRAGGYPELVDADITRDFVYVDDVVEAFVDAALWATNWHSPGREVINIGTGEATSIRDVAETARRVFDIPGEPEFTMVRRSWDHGQKWFVDPTWAYSMLSWQARTPFEDGLRKTARWHERSH